MLKIENISKKFREFSLNQVSFTVDDGDYYILLGPSGSGKTMMLEIMAGLTIQDSGKILIDEIDVSQMKIQKRPFGIVFQDHAIFPHMTVRENIIYPYHSVHLSLKEIQAKLDLIAEKTELIELLNRRPSTLSGGELQRVALARTLAKEPRYLLLDEPLASLDVRLRHDLRRLLKQLNSAGQTIIHVTHDYEEAILLANKVGAIHEGRIIQSGPASEVFHYPKSEFVARFTGIRNYFPVKLSMEGDKVFGILDNGLKIRVSTSEDRGNGFLVISSENIVISNELLESSAKNNFKGIIKEINPIPQGFEVVADVGIHLFISITRESLEDLQLFEGKTVWLSFKATSTRFIRQ